MLFIDRPITAEHIRSFCERFSEGLRVEYKSTFDENVKGKIAKIAASFANSLGGVFVIGVNTQNGVPRPPFEGFQRPEREEIPLTVENLCLSNMNPGLPPNTTIVQAEGNNIFVVIEVEESGEAPHAVENSRKVYVRTGNAANPYDLADVDQVLDLVKRRATPLERRERMTKLAEERSRAIVRRNNPYLEISVSPSYPRNEMCNSEDVWNFLVRRQHQFQNLLPANYLRRVPEGAANIFPGGRHGAESLERYLEANKYGLFYSAKPFATGPWGAGGENSLRFNSLSSCLIDLIRCACDFYGEYGYQGRLLTRISLQKVHGMPMAFVPLNPVFGEPPEDYRCHADIVSAERFVDSPAISDLAGRTSFIVEIFTELTWAFCQGNGPYPSRRAADYWSQAIE